MSQDCPETPYLRPDDYAEHYRDRRFQTRSGRQTNARETSGLLLLLQRLAEQGHLTSGTWLDLPSGAGRFSDLLPKPVLRADRSLAMLQSCDNTMARLCASVHRIPLADHCMTGALCMRLLHHIPHSNERLQILRELHRVCTGPMILSFFCSASLQHWRRLLARKLYKPTSGRVAVSWRQFRGELERAGWTVFAIHPLRRYISEQWLVACLPKSAVATTQPPDLP